MAICLDPQRFHTAAGSISPVCSRRVERRVPVCANDSLFDFVHGVLHLWKAKLEAGRKQTKGDDPAALDYQLSLRPMNKGRNFKHPACCGQSKGHAKLMTDYPHQDRKSTRLNSSHLVI